ncbi:MAG: hypothetical protein AAGF07_01790 [Patescibacteria group bacterium]
MPSRSHTLPNGYYVNARPIPVYRNDRPIPKNTRDINVVEPLDNVSILNSIVVQEIITKDDKLIVKRYDDIPNGQRKLHSLLVSKDIARLATKYGLRFITRQQALSKGKGIFRHLPKNRQVILGNIDILEKFVLPNQVGDRSHGCLRIPIALSNKIANLSKRFRLYRQQRINSRVNSIYLYENDMSKIPTHKLKQEDEMTLMFKVLD